MPDPIIDPLEGPAYGIHGRIVTMNDDHEVIARGTVWVESGVIRSITRDGERRPEGFGDVRVMRPAGTVFPGMIELHNHLPYDVLNMWTVPKPYTNRGQWGSHADYRKLVSGPMKILGKTAGYIEAVVRYVEVKALVAGVTTSQGVALYSNARTRRYHRGLVRNVEDTNDPELPEADSRVADVDATDAVAFLERLRRGRKIILHLAEGVDDAAHSHFEALRTTDHGWAISDALIGIHAACLKKADFEVLASHGGSMVWSPASNLMLYGGTAPIDEARRAGVNVSLGSDWSPTGSKNLLAELKVARAAADASDWMLTDRDLVDMVTRNPARALGWDKSLGSIQPGHRADLFAVYGRRGDPYRQLLRSTERSVVLVIVGGVPRYGQSRHMPDEAERLRVGGSARRLFLEQAAVDPIVAEVSFGTAVDRLEDGLSRLPELAENMESAVGVAATDLGGTRGIPPATALGIERGGERWVLELQHEEADSTTMRPPLGVDDGLPSLGPVRAAEKLSDILEPLDLDRLTVIDDRGYRDRLRTQPNLPEKVAELL